MSFIDGLSSGLDTTSIINQLMQLERRPQQALTTRKTQEEAARTELSAIRADVSALRNQAADLQLATGWDRLAATSSNEDAVSVLAGSSATTGSYSFQVTSVASAASVYSTQTYASLDSNVVAGGSSVFQASGYSGLGFQSLSGTGFAEGPIDFSVIQASGTADIEGGNIPTIPITIDGTNDSIDFEVDGFSFSVTLTHATYDTEAALAAAVSDAIAADQAAAAVATASLSANNRIQLSSIAEGSDHSIQFTGGTAGNAIGFPVLGLSGSGVDGIVEVDGTQTIVTDATSGSEVTLASGGPGSVAAVLSGGLRVGSASVSQAGAGSGSLADIVATVNAADLDYVANAVNTGNGYRLQLTAKETGADSTIVPDPELFGGIDFTVLSNGTDAELTVQGDNPFTIVSSTNTFDELLPGVTVTVNAVTATPVTVSTERDVEAVAETVGELVTKMNELLTRITASTRNEPDGTRAVLQGNREARRAADQLRQALVGPVEGNALTAIGLVGIELTREGTLTFDAEAFKNTMTTDATVLTELFSDRTATGEPGVLDRFVDAAEAATSVGEGYLYTAGQSSDRLIEDYSRQIDSFERRMEVRESTLRRTYANLEVALGGLQQQSSWLTSQLGSLGSGQ